MKKIIFLIGLLLSASGPCSVYGAAAESSVERVPQPKSGYVVPTDHADDEAVEVDGKSSFANLVLQMTDEPKTFELMYHSLNGFNPESEVEQQQIEDALNTLAYNILRPILVEGPEHLGVKTPDKIQKYIVKRLLSEVLGKILNTAEGTVPAVKHLGVLARNLLPKESVPNTYARTVSEQVVHVIMNRFSSLQEGLFSCTVTPITKIPARAMSVYLTDVDGANIGRQLRQSIGSLPQQLEDARPAFRRSWEGKLDDARALIETKKAGLETVQERLRRYRPKAVITDEINAKSEEIRTFSAAEPPVSEALATAREQAAEAKRAFETAERDVEARAAEASGAGILSFGMGLISRAQRAFVDPPELAEARSSLNAANKRVLDLEDEGRAEKEARIRTLEDELAVVHAELGERNSVRMQIQSLMSQIRELTVECDEIQKNIEKFRGRELLEGASFEMPEFFLSGIRLVASGTRRSDEALYKALNLLGGSSQTALDRLIGRPLPALGNDIAAELQEAGTFLSDTINGQYAALRHEFEETGTAAERFIRGEGGFENALNMFEGALNIAGRTLPLSGNIGEIEEIKELVSGVQRRIPATSATLKRLYGIARYIRETGETAVQAFGWSTLAYASLYFFDLVDPWENGTLESLDNMRFGVLSAPAEVMHISPSLLYTTIPLVGSAVLAISKNPEIREIAAGVSVVSAPVAAAWFAPVLAPTIGVVSITSLINWETAKTVTFAATEVLQGATKSAYEMVSSYMPSWPW